MRVVGRVLEAGRGRLGGTGYPTYEVRVVDSTTTLTSRDGTRSEESVAHEVLWWKADDPELPLAQRPVAKLFATPAAREAFLAAGVRPQLDLHPLDELVFERPHPLAEVVGDWLVAVTFLVSGLQLDIQPTGATPVPPHRGPLTYHAPPLLHAGGATLADGDPGYADGIVDLVGQGVVEGDDDLDLGLVLGFAGGAFLSAGLDADDGYEVATFPTPGGLHVWMPR